MSYLGSWKIDDFLTFYVNTHTAATGAATDADAVPPYRIYEDETGAAIANGNMALLDAANTVGFYSERIQLQAVTGFEKGKQYAIYISSTVATVEGTIHHTFQIEAEVDANTVSQTVDANLTEMGGVAQSATDLKDFADDGYDPATNKVEGVKLADVTTTNTDARGTDNAALAATALTDATWTDVRAGYLDELAAANLPTDIADIPTVAEFEARTIPSADYFDPAADTVVDVTTVGTTTTNTDMRGTDGANTVTPLSAAQTESEVNDALVALKLDHLVAVADGDDPVDDSIVAKLAASDGDWSGFVPADDSQEAIRDRGDAAWGTGAAAPTATAIVDEWEAQSQADPTGFHVNVQEIAGTAQTANDNGADINTLISRITAAVALASVCTEGRLSELDGANVPADIDTLLGRVTAAVALASVCTEARLAELAAGNLPTDIADIPTVAEFNARTLVAASYFDPGTDTVVTVTTVTNLTNAPTSGDLTATMKASVNSEVDTALSDYAGPTKAEMDAAHALLATPAEVNAEVLDVLNVDTFAEPGQEAPAATTTIQEKISYLYKALRNRLTQTGTTMSLYNSAGAVVDQKATVSDDLTTFDRSTLVSGP